MYNKLVAAIKSLYKLWNKNYCQGQFLFNTGLKEEPYFMYFSYPDFLTPYSGLIQIRKYAEIHNLDDLQEQFAQINALSKKVCEITRAAPSLKGSSDFYKERKFSVNGTDLFSGLLKNWEGLSFGNVWYFVVRFDNVVPIQNNYFFIFTSCLNIFGKY